MSTPDPRCQRSLTANELASRSAHRLHGHLHTVLGFAELLAEDGEESGPLLLDAARQLRVRLDTLLHLHDRCVRGWTGRGAAVEAIIDELGLPAGLAIDNRLPSHTHLAVDPRGLRALLAEIGTVVAPTPLLLAGGDAALEISATLVAENVADGDGAVSIAVIEALVADLGATLALTDAAPGLRLLTVRLPLAGGGAE